MAGQSGEDAVLHEEDSDAASGLHESFSEVPQVPKAVAVDGIVGLDEHVLCHGPPGTILYTVLLSSIQDTA